MPADPTASLSPAQRRSLETVLALLAEERASVSSVTDDRAWKVHVADSLTGLEVPELREAHRIADVGAGAGFPGLVLAVALPDAQVDLSSRCPARPLSSPTPRPRRASPTPPP